MLDPLICTPLMCLGISQQKFPLPGSEYAGVQMDEIRLGIIAYSAASQRSRRIPESSGGEIRYADINGPTFHVKAFLGNAPSALAQTVVGLWRSVTRNDFDGASASGSRLNFTKHVQEAGIDGMGVSRPKVSKKPSDFFLHRSGTSSRGMNDL